jgi:menaquinone-dependent protoporphyrinogen oxidase
MTFSRQCHKELVMKVQVIYGTRLGATRQIAERLAQRLGEAGLEATSLAPEEVVGEPDGDAFVVGSGVYAGHWQKALTRFALEKAPTLRQRPVWLFSSGPLGDTAVGSAPVEPKEAKELGGILNARGHRVFAGALERDAIKGSDLNRLERAITRRFIPEGDWRDWDAIDRWADEIAASLLQTAVQGVAT